MKTSFILSAGALMAAVTLPVLTAAPAVAALPNVTLQAREVVNLWPASAPDESGSIGPEHVLPDRPRPFDQITNVTVPTLAVFLPPAEKRTGTGVLVIPGGGLERLALEHEGFEVAEWLMERGIAAFVLKYRVPARSREQRWKAGLQDAQRAMSLIRSRAAAWQVDADAIGTIGFSAGAEINVLLSVSHTEARQYAAVDTADAGSTRPDFNLAIYGGGLVSGRDGALRTDIASRINRETPPMFIAHAFDDQALNSIALMQALKRAGVVSELHVFGAGGHGFGVRESGLPVGAWRELALKWLGWQGFLDTPAVRTFAREFARAGQSEDAAWPRFQEGAAGELGPAYAAQRRIVRQAARQGGAIAGYKGAFTSAGAQAAAGLRHPVHGVLLKAGRIEAAAQPVTIQSRRPLLVETEIGYVIATDIGTQLRVPRQALTAVEALVPVIELPVNPGSLRGGALVIDPREAVAGNVGSNRFIVGRTSSTNGIETLDALPVSLRRDGQTLHAASGADVLGGQAQMLMTLINQIIAQGHVLHRGDVILTGALGRPQPGEKGNYRADFGRLGTIEFRIE